MWWWMNYDDNYDDDNDNVILESFNVNKWKCKVNNIINNYLIFVCFFCFTVTIINDHLCNIVWGIVIYWIIACHSL